MEPETVHVGAAEHAPSEAQAPPVVAVVVVHEPGPWFEDTIDAFARQDYPNLRFLFLVASDVGDRVGDRVGDTVDGDGAFDAVEQRITARLPDAFVRPAVGNPGFGAIANEVLRLVEGDHGLFLVCHDDIAMDPAALRLMVEELYRSNAGAVGPKLVEWDDPRALRSVGMGVDRFGEVDHSIELGELDQEQHDGVRDVFAVPSACILIRADLFRELDGFDPSLSFHGEDVELCWRIHHSGARVVVAPSARVRHREELARRRSDLNHARLAAQHRMRTVATLTGGSRLPGRSIEMVLLTIAELVVGVFTATFGQAWASLRALVGLVPRTPSLLARRRAVKPLRRVPEREVSGLQVRGSARLASYLRTRDVTTYVSEDSTVRRWRDGTTGPVIAWLCVLAGVVIGSRAFFTDGVPSVGEFLPFPSSPRLLLDSFLSGWNATGAGATEANPTGWATLAGFAPFTLFRMGLLQTLLTVGLLVVGVGGMWKFATVFPSTRARIGAFIVFAATPLIGGAMAGGRLTVLVVYAATPWIVHLLRRAAALETADPATAATDLTDGVTEIAWPERVRRIVVAGLVVGLAAAFAPVIVVVTVVIAVCLALGTLLALASWRVAAWFAVCGAGASLVAVLLNTPWVATWRWADLVGAPPIGDPGRGLVALASFEIGPTDFAVLAVALFVPVVAAIMLAKAWRLTWAVRAAVLVIVFGALAVLGDRGSLPFDVPEAGVLLVPVAFGVSVSAGALLAGFDLDVRDAGFGWRQPLGILAMIAIVVGVVPGVLAVGGGQWNTPDTTLGRLMNAWSVDQPTDGDYRVLLLGDSRVLPVPSTEYRDGLSWAIVDDGDLDVRDRWAPPSTPASDVITEALDQVASSSTLRAGRLLAPLGIRYIVIPEFDGVNSTTDSPIVTADGLSAALDDQLDLASVTGGFPTLEIYENGAWLPTVSLLAGATAEASRTAGTEALLRADLTDAVGIMPGADQFEVSSADVTAGVVQLGIPYDPNWTLSVDGAEIPARRSFGISTAFDSPAAGVAELRYDTPASRAFLVGLQVTLWAAAIFIALKIRVPRARRARTYAVDETLIVLPSDAAVMGPPMVSSVDAAETTDVAEVPT